MPLRALAGSGSVFGGLLGQDQGSGLQCPRCSSSRTVLSSEYRRNSPAPQALTSCYGKFACFRAHLSYHTEFRSMICRAETAAFWIMASCDSPGRMVESVILHVTSSTCNFLSLSRLPRVARTRSCCNTRHGRRSPQHHLSDTFARRQFATRASPQRSTPTRTVVSVCDLAARPASILMFAVDGFRSEVTNSMHGDSNRDNIAW